MFLITSDEILRRTPLSLRPVSDPVHIVAKMSGIFLDSKTRYGVNRRWNRFRISFYNRKPVLKAGPCIAPRRISVGSAGPI
jgi:hypothetical protein